MIEFIRRSGLYTPTIQLNIQVIQEKSLMIDTIESLDFLTLP